MFNPSLKVLICVRVGIGVSPWLTWFMRAVDDLIAACSSLQLTMLAQLKVSWTLMSAEEYLSSFYLWLGRRGCLMELISDGLSKVKRPSCPLYGSSPLGCPTSACYDSGVRYYHGYSLGLNWFLSVFLTAIMNANYADNHAVSVQSCNLLENDYVASGRCLHFSTWKCSGHASSNTSCALWSAMK